MSKFENYYDKIEEIDPANSREENLVSLSKARIRWSKRHGQTALIMVALIDLAIDIFHNEEKYREFRAWWEDQHKPPTPPPPPPPPPDHPDDIKDLQWKVDNDGHLLLKWEAPENVKGEVVVAWRNDGFPQSHDDPDTIIKKCPLNGLFILDSPSEDEYFFKVFTVDKKGAFSQGVTLHVILGNSLSITYRIEKRKAKYYLVLQKSLNKNKRIDIPPIQLRAKKNEMPEHARDGTIVQSWQEGISIGMNSHEIRLELDTSGISKGRHYGKLFFLDGSSEGDTFLLDHPDKSDVKIG